MGTAETLEEANEYAHRLVPVGAPIIQEPKEQK
jgi:hypothetical protein